ncbi:golgin candidate 6 isoform X2 [Physcomitrium patens]|nr:golgin candidate 6-like isoform X2 [Physcomitrium patens]PNR58045.1 hypothetical protein PHYPA_005040 [Physcomitrium patens]|eukprot:XP_024370992.1 golgin candidate 6-like isoform X2 [Physcomitrella patens]
MAFKLGSLNLNAVAQGVGGLVFGTNNYGRDEDDGGVEELLERISNGKLADDRRNAMQELEAAVAENRAAKLAFGAMGFPILMEVFREDREDLELVRGALETLLHATTTEDIGQEEPGQVQPGIVNSELFARESASIALVLSLLDEPDFYVRYHTLQILTALLTNCPERLQDLILSIPQGITRLMDMLAEREVIRNEALIVLAYLTRSAEEIQKIVVFEGALDRLFNIIREEGGSEGGIIVQDCLELLNNLLRNNPSNQIFLRETLGLQCVAQLLKLRKGSADGFTQQKSINLLCALETVALLLSGGPDAKPGKDANIVANQTLLAQNKLLDILLALSVEGRVSAVAIRCSALRCIGDLVVGHPANQVLLGSKMIGEEPDAEPALHCVLRSLLKATNLSECIAAEYVVKCYCEGNSDGQTMLASTITPLPQSIAQGNDRLVDDEIRPSFGSMLVGALISSDGRNDLEASCRAASVLSHILKNNVQCKERVLKIPLKIPSSSASPPELLMPCCMKYLAAASPTKSPNNPETIWLQPVFLRLLVTWVAECPPAVTALFEQPAHLPFLIELLGSTGSPASVHVAGLAAVLLGTCIIFNSEENSTDSSAVVDLISQKVGLTNFFAKWEDMEKSSLFASALSSSRLPQALTRSTAAAAAAGDGMVSVPFDQQQQVQMYGGSDKEPLVTTFYDAEFVTFLKQLEPLIKERVVDLFSRPKARVVVDFKGFEQKKGESDSEYMHRLKSLLQAQAQELQELLERNSAITSDLLLHSKGDGSSQFEDGCAIASVIRGRNGTSANRAEVETLKQQLEVAQQWADAVRDEKNEIEKEYAQFRQMAAEKENDFKGLSDAYNALEQENSRLEDDNITLRKALEGGGVVPASLSSKELEDELNELLVCLGQEETKVERLSARLRELGEDVDKLLDGIGDQDGEADAEDDDEDEDDN